MPPSNNKMQYIENDVEQNMGKFGSLMISVRGFPSHMMLKLGMNPYYHNIEVSHEGRKVAIYFIDNEKITGIQILDTKFTSTLAEIKLNNTLMYNGHSARLR
jgi:hypothetical protein